MDTILFIGGWLWWALSTTLAVGWQIVWFLLGGWVVTLAQVAVVALVIFGYKYGWSAAPAALFERLSRFFGWAWAWVRKRELPPRAHVPARDPRLPRDRPRRSVRQWGDVNLSSLLNGVLVGLLLVWGVSLS